MKWFPSGALPLMVTHNDTANDQVDLAASTHSLSAYNDNNPILFPSNDLSNYCAKTYKTEGAIGVPGTNRRGLGVSTDPRITNEEGHQYILIYASFTGNVHKLFTPQFKFGRTGTNGNEVNNPTAVVELPTLGHHRADLGSSRFAVQCHTSAIILNSSPTFSGNYQPCVWLQFYNYGSSIQNIEQDAYWTFNIYRFHQLTELYDPRG